MTKLVLNEFSSYLVICFYPWINVWKVLWCGRNYLFEPKAKKHIPFFSYTTKHKKQHFPFFRSSSFCTRRSTKDSFFFLPKQPLMLWWWLSYICLYECLWMQMLWCNVMCKWMSKHIYEAIVTTVISLETITYQRWLFAVSSAFP